MLARVADNLFWMGRYIERTEHIARYLNVNYFSSLDAPDPRSQSKDFVLRSMMSMAGINPQEETKLKQQEVLYQLGLDPETPISIINAVRNARENALSARDLISTELYEAINKFYHYVNDYPPKTFMKTGLFDFTTHNTEMTAIIRAKMRGTLFHDSIYAIIMMGVNLERAIQITRIIQTKFLDAELSTHDDPEGFRTSYEWTTLLKCAESYDMMRRLYKKQPTSLSTLEFLILNPNCPRSVMNSLNQVYRHVCHLDPSRIKNKASAAFMVGKTRAAYQFMKVEEIESDTGGFIEGILSELSDIGFHLEKEFFSY
ncbi:alpha-E domain-containing protein [Robiginitalea sp.]|uniref:alpha-E domain-containing protein n=1 Tax=Robiginitalea sp. TaxID=1902411 RepID=UPI003C5F8477